MSARPLCQSAPQNRRSKPRRPNGQPAQRRLQRVPSQARSPVSTIDVVDIYRIHGSADGGALAAGSKSYGFYPDGNTWWSKYALLFNKFKFATLSATYEPALSINAAGQVAFAVDSDPSPNQLVNFQTVAASFGAKTTSVRERASTQARPTQLARLPWYASNSVEQPSSTCCRVHIAWTDCSLGSAVSGDVTIGRIIFRGRLVVSEASPAGHFAQPLCQFTVANVAPTKPAATAVKFAQQTEIENTAPILETHGESEFRIRTQRDPISLYQWVSGAANLIADLAPNAFHLLVPGAYFFRRKVESREL